MKENWQKVLRSWASNQGPKQIDWNNWFVDINRSYLSWGKVSEQVLNRKKKIK